VAASRRERKVVTVVFCDLVGFTSRAEQLDPEDVEALLTPYHERLRAELERYGGTVEKFIGDAVMALFGAPTAHEDDAERAVRACLAIRDWAIEEDDVQVRIAVTTGEALIRLDARPEAGEGMASGDVVNTAARLQSAAPVNGIVADETTYRATRHVVDYRDAAAVEAKGKAEPIAVWEVAAAHSRFGVDVAHQARTELVGRERELNVVRDAFERARHERTPQLLTLVGIPGIGKSRLVYELSQIVDTDPELITWRQGRCLAYGDGVTLWALGEIVKAQAGIVEQDTPADVEQKLRDAVADVLAETSDASWVESELRSLVGLAGESELGDDRRGAAFAAWRRFLEAMAEQRPLVIVFEDLHWADESLLDFVDELVDWVTEVPLLVVATARPELLERRPDWAGGKLNATTLALAPLSNEQTAHLIAHLLDRPVLPAESQQVLLERAGGNPLYAEQFAELYLERGSTEELSLPETLQGIIAARLDGLAQSEKELLRDAAVVGKVFWAAALSREATDPARTLHSLERKGFVRRQKRSSVEGESEFAFAHALVRDVAYGQIARADRAEKHRHAAEWIESLGRPEDHAEMLAYHWRSALELAGATGQPTGELAERARLALREAGDRAFALNSYPAAERYYAEALELWPDPDPNRPELLFRRAHALYFVGDDRGEEALVEARDALLTAGSTERAAEAEAFLASVAWFNGLSDKVMAHLDRAAELAGGTPSAAKARVLSISARTRTVSGEPEAGMRIAEEALEMADALGLDELRAHALGTIGTAKTILGDLTGVAELERALEIAVEINSPIAGAIVNNLAFGVPVGDGGLLRAEELHAESARLAERFGDGQVLRLVRGNMVWLDWVRGRWDDALENANRFVAECEAGSPHGSEGYVRLDRASIRLGQGDTEGALADHARALAVARDAKDPAMLAAVAAVSAGNYAELGRWDDARTLVDELIPVIRAHPGAAGWESVVAPYAGHLGVREELREIVETAPPSAWTDASLLSLDLDFRGAAEIFAAMPSPTLEARQRSSAGEHLIEAGRRAEGEVELAKALAFYRSVGATFFIQRAEALLAKSA